MHAAYTVYLPPRNLSRQRTPSEKPLLKEPVMAVLLAVLMAVPMVPVPMVPVLIVPVPIVPVPVAVQCARVNRQHTLQTAGTAICMPVRCRAKLAHRGV
jgi:hypothetical protein